MQAANQHGRYLDRKSRQEFCSVAPATCSTGTFSTDRNAMLAEQEYMQVRVRVGIFSSVRCVSSPAE